MDIPLEFFLIENLEIHLLFNSLRQPVVKINTIYYRSFLELLAVFPFFKLHCHLEKTAQISNFLAKGTEFQYISSIENYKKERQQLIQQDDERDSYDLSLIHSAKLNNNLLVYFVQHDYSKNLYKVSINLAPSNHPSIKYQLLPAL